MRLLNSIYGMTDSGKLFPGELTECLLGAGKETLAKVNSEGYQNLINNQTFIVEYPEKDEPVTPCMNVYKSDIKSDGGLHKLKPRIVVRGGMQNTKLVEDIWSPIASIRTLRYFLSDATKHKSRVH